jgi:hypothetical protein
LGFADGDCCGSPRDSLYNESALEVKSL